MEQIVLNFIVVKTVKPINLDFILETKTFFSSFSYHSTNF